MVCTQPASELRNRPSCVGWKGPAEGEKPALRDTRRGELPIFLGAMSKNFNDGWPPAPMAAIAHSAGLAPTRLAIIFRKLPPLLQRHLTALRCQLQCRFAP